MREAAVRETNDYFRLLERGRVTNEITYFFDDEGRTTPSGSGRS